MMSFHKICNTPVCITATKLASIFCALSFVLNCSSNQVLNNIPNKDKNKAVSKVLHELSGLETPGVQYVVVSKDSTIFKQTVGLSNIKTGMPLSSEHKLAAFSMTKTLTAIAILQLHERELIDIDDRALKYIEHPYDSDITIRQLVSHTAGIPNPIPLKWVHLEHQHSNFNDKKVLKTILKEHSTSQSNASTEYNYSNIGYWLLGSIIEKVTMDTYSQYVTKHIFDTIGLTANDIGFAIVKNNSHAKGYLKRWSLMNIFGRFFIDKQVLGDYEGDWLHINNVYLNGPSFGGAFGSATAFSKILQDLLSQNSKLLKNKTKKLLYSPQKTNSGQTIAMTLGWHTDKLGDLEYYYKEGGGAGFHCEMRIYPKTGIASVIMANRTSFNTRKILTNLDSHFLK